MLKIVHSKKRLNDRTLGDHHTSKEMVEWTRDFLTDLDDLIEGHLTSTGEDRFPAEEVCPRG